MAGRLHPVFCAVRANLLRARLVGRVIVGLATLGLPAKAAPEMALNGQWNVTNTGAFTYTIPLRVPPGVHGLAPHLGLTYSSQAGDGDLGLGWSISGLSAITRCPATLAQDGTPGGITYTSNDRFCLDGNRLIVTAGTYGTPNSTYQVEVTNYESITANGSSGNGPASFDVYLRDGTHYQYGLTSNSQVLVAPPGNKTVRVWALSTITDTKGNTITFTYNNGNQPSTEYYITEIDYGPNNKITFDTQSRPDQIPAYQAGYEMLMTQRISAIHTLVGTASVLDYTFTYNDASSGTASHDELATISECHTTICLATTQLGWQGSGFTPTFASQNPNVNVANAVVTPGDFNGDGLTDILVQGPVYNCSESGNGNIYQGNGNGYDFTSVAMTAYYDYYPQSGTGHDQNVWNNYAACFNPLNLPALWPDTIAADINGDGISDIVANEPTWTSAWLPNPNSEVLITSGSTINQKSIPLQYLGASVLIRGDSTFPSDFNNDGLPDAIDSNNNILLGDGTGNFTTTGQPIPGQIAADFDGDGCTDLLNQIPGQTYKVNFSPLCNPAVLWAYAPSTFTNSSLVYGDFNGDGKTDVITYNPSQSGPVNMYLSTGTGFTSAYSICGSCDWSQYTVVTGDWNGDGRTDIALISKSSSVTSKLWLSKGTSLTYLDTGLSGDPTASPVVADFNNDGASDIWIETSLAASEMLFGYQPELMTSVNNGLGATTSVNYQRLNDTRNPIYTNPRDDAYPIQDINGPFYVPQAITVTGAGTQDNLGWAYKYTELKKDLRGRGLLGFSSIAITDPNNKVRTITYHASAVINGVDQADVPYVGLPASDTITASGTTISNVAYSWTDQSGSNQYVYFPYVLKTVFTGADPGGGSLPEVDTSYTVDQYGNILTQTVSHPHTDSFTSTTTNQYQYNTNPWIVNELTSNTVENVLGSSDITRVTTYNPEQNTGLIDGLTIQPGDGNLELDINYLYDGFGNPKQITEQNPNGNFPSSQTQLSWGATGQFPQTVTNALSYQSQFTFDSGFGTKTSVKDPNQITETWVPDALGRPFTFTTPAGATTTQTYSYCSSQQSCQPESDIPAVTGSFYVKTTVTAGSHNLAPVTYTYYDAFSRVVAVDKQTFDGSGWIRIATTYDNLGHLNTVTQPYALSGGQAETTSYGGYDVLNRVGSVTYPIDGTPGTATTHYTYSALTVTVEDANNHSTITTRNAEGLISDVLDAATGDTKYAYDAFGDAVKITTPGQNVIQNSFDKLGRNLQSVDPDMGTWTYTYDALGELITQTSPNELAQGQTTTLTYDALGRLTTRSEPDMYAQWNYDTAQNGIGRLANATCVAPVNPPQGAANACTSAGYTRSYSYDSYGRQNELTIQIGSGPQTTGYYTTETYDTNTTQLVRVRAFSGFTVNYNYNAQGYLCEISDYSTGGTGCSDSYSQFYWQANAMDAFSHITQETAGNSIVTTNTYSPATGNLQGIAAGPSYNIENMTYAWNKVGDLTDRTDNLNNFAENFCYDALNRLQFYSVGGSDCHAGTLLSKLMAYGGVGDGNIGSKSDIGAYSYNGAGHHAVSSIDTHTTGAMVDGVANPNFFYDADGNMACVTSHALTSCGPTAARSYTWTSFDKLEKVQQGTKVGTFTYTPEHERFTQTTPSGVLMYASDPVGGIMAERFSGGTTTWRTYLMAYGRTVAERFTQGANVTMDYLAGDHLQSTVALTNTNSQSGPYAIAETDSYDAWGKRRNVNGTDNANCSLTSGTLRGFSGQEMMDSFCLVNLNGRIYDPTIARMLSADPTVPDPMNGQSYNRYTYVANDPLSYVDPSGYAEVVVVIGHRIHCEGGCGGAFSGGGSGQSGGSGGDGGGGGVVERVVVIGHRLPPGQIQALINQLQPLGPLTSDSSNVCTGGWGPKLVFEGRAAMYAGGWIAFGGANAAIAGFGIAGVGATPGLWVMAFGGTIATIGVTVDLAGSALEVWEGNQSGWRSAVSAAFNKATPPNLDPNSQVPDQSAGALTPGATC